MHWCMSSPGNLKFQSSSPNRSAIILFIILHQKSYYYVGWKWHPVEPSSDLGVPGTGTRYDTVYKLSFFSITFNLCHINMSHPPGTSIFVPSLWTGLPTTLIIVRSCFRKFTYFLSAPRSWWFHVSKFHFWKTGFSSTIGIDTSSRISLAPLLNSTQLCIDWHSSNDECINGTIDGNCLHIDFVDMLLRSGYFELLWWLCSSCAGCGCSRALERISEVS